MVKTDPKKIQAVRDWSPPRNKKGVQSFIGFLNYYRRFVKDFSKIARPLHQLTGNQPFTWESAQQEAFEILKERLCSRPILFLPIDDGPFRIETDCSQYAMGGVLSQHIEGKWRTIAYRSQSLSEAERNYKLHDRELLSIMEALKDWRQYLLGAKHKVEVWTDHLNLTYFRQPNKLNKRQARWHTKLQSYNLLLIHKPGTLMRKADILSRINQLDEGKDDNANETILSEKMFAQPAIVFSPTEEQLSTIRENYTRQDWLEGL